MGCARESRNDQAIYVRHERGLGLERRPYEDKGVILTLKPERVLQYSHFSPLSGQSDVPEHYHTVTIELSLKGTGTLLMLSQDNNSTEEDREHSEKNWGMMLTGLKKFLEK